MDQSLKERLVGAAVLVALGVWLIPWLLDGRQEQVNLGSPSSALRLPAPDGPLPVRTQTLALDAAKSDPFVAEAPRPETSTTLAAAEPTSAAPNVLPKATQPTPPVAASERVAAAAPAKPVSERGATPRVAAAPKPAEPPAVHAALAKTEARGDWAVQLGVFGAEDNARRLAQKVNVYGYKPAVASYKSNGRAMYRVRLGPFVSRAEADATASALSAHSFPAQVVAVD